MKADKIKNSGKNLTLCKDFLNLCSKRGILYGCQYNMLRDAFFFFFQQSSTTVMHIQKIITASCNNYKNKIPSEELLSVYIYSVLTFHQTHCSTPYPISGTYFDFYSKKLVLSCRNFNYLSFELTSFKIS